MSVFVLVFASIGEAVLDDPKRTIVQTKNCYWIHIIPADSSIPINTQ